MLNEEEGKNCEAFAPNARTYFILSRLFSTLMISIVLFPLIVLLPLTLVVTGYYAMEYQKRLRFRMEDTHFFVRRGVILYAYTLIPYENIQDIHVVQGWLEQLFGIWSVVVFTATTTARGSETVPGLDKASAERLKTTLFERIREARHVTD